MSSSRQEYYQGLVQAARKARDCDQKQDPREAKFWAQTCLEFCDQLIWLEELAS